MLPPGSRNWQLIYPHSKISRLAVIYLPSNVNVSRNTNWGRYSTVDLVIKVAYSEGAE
jgi:hypothetical protein